MQTSTIGMNDHIELDREQARDLFDREARQYLGMSAEEFVREYDAGHLPDSGDVLYLLMVRDYAA